jgi:hypothetical protein
MITIDWRESDENAHWLHEGRRDEDEHLEHGSEPESAAEFEEQLREEQDEEDGFVSLDRVVDHDVDPETGEVIVKQDGGAWFEDGSCYRVIDEDGEVVGVAVDFPESDVYLDWKRDAFDNELDHPHVSIYGSLDDARQATGNSFEAMRNEAIETSLLKVGVNTGEIVVTQTDPDDLPPPDHRQYVEGPDDAPEGVPVHEGPQGGVFVDRRKALAAAEDREAVAEHAPAFDRTWAEHIRDAPSMGASENEYDEWVGQLTEPFYDLHSSLREAFSGSKTRGRLKDAGSLKTKREDRKEGYDDDPLEHMDDIIGMRVLTDTSDDLEQTVRRLQEWSVAEGAEVREVDDKFREDPAGGYYRAVHVVVTVDGVPAEFQVMSEQVEEVKEWAQDFAGVYKGDNDDDPQYLDYAEKLGEWAFQRERGVDVEKPECPPRVRENGHCFGQYGHVDEAKI